MAVALTYPGVYIEELPSGARTIVGVPTSITAFLGRAARGPEDKPVDLTGYAEFERIFGGLAEYSTMSYAVRQFFDNGGSRAIIVRLYRPSEAALAAGNEVVAAAEAATGTTAAAVKAAARARADAIVADAGRTQEAKDAARSVARAVEATRGTLEVGDVMKAVEASAQGSATAPQAVADAVASVVDAARAKAAEAGATADDVKEAAREQADTFTEDGPAKDAADAVADAAEAVTEASLVKAAANEAKQFSHATLSRDTLRLRAANPGTWGANLRARVDYVGLDTQAPDAAKRFNLTVTDGVTVESFLDLTIEPGQPRSADQVLEAESSLVRWDRAFSPPSRPTVNPDPTDPDAAPFSKDDDQDTQPPADQFLTDGVPIPPNDYYGSEVNRTGLRALDGVDLFNLLCIPPPVRGGNPLPKATTERVLAYCVRRRAFYVADGPTAWDDSPAQFSSFITGNLTEKLNDLGLAGDAARNGAVFFPRILAPDPLRGGRTEKFAVSGAIAGLISRTDANRGVWKAPAGTEASVVGIQGLAVRITDDQHGKLNPLGINSLRTFPVIGTVNWGARTLKGADRLADTDNKYISVRRLTLFIEESLFRGTQFAVFEPNDASLWGSLRLAIKGFMQDLLAQGAFYTFDVQCDDKTTLQRDIEVGRVNALVRFRPVKPAEFVVIRIQQMAGQSA